MQMSVAKTKRIGLYQLGDLLGRGSAGTVYRGLNWRTGEVVAVKQFHIDGFASTSDAEGALKEIDMLKSLRHPNIVKYVGYEQSENELSIVLEYCEGGSLQHLLRKFGKLPENLVGVYVAQILEGLIYLHDNAVVHRDIKPGNLLTTKEGKVKLADFGVARFHNGNATVVGSPYWIAPEVIQLNGATAASDIWSLGCTIIQLVDGKAPYEDLPPISAIFKIGNDEHPPYPSNISQPLQDFLSKCLNRAPDGRSSARELANHQWIRWCQDMKMDGDYESNVKYISDWHVALAKSSPRDVLRHSSRGAFNIDQAFNNQSVTTPLGTGSTCYAPYMVESAAQRTVSSIAKYEENSDDDWDNAFENLDDLQFKRRPKIPPYIADSTHANPIPPAEIVRRHALSFTSDMQADDEAASAAAATAAAVAVVAGGSAAPPHAERSVTHPRMGNGQQASGNGHVPLRAHTSPPSPNMRKRRTQTRSQDTIEVPGTPDEEDEEQVPLEDGFAGSGAGLGDASSLYNHSAVIARRNSMSTNHRAAKRPSLGLQQLPLRKMSTQDSVQGSRSVMSQAGGLAEGLRGRTYSSLSLETADLSCGDQSASVDKASALRQPDLDRIYENKSVEHRLQREAELKWIREVAGIINELKLMLSEDTVVQRCRSLNALLREGNGVVVASPDWHLRYVVEAISQYRANSHVVRHLLQVVLRLQQLNKRYLRTFCLHGLLPLTLPILQMRLQQGVPSFSADHELRGEALRLADRVCRDKDTTVVHSFLACGGVTALCNALDSLADVDVEVGWMQVARVLSTLVNLVTDESLREHLSTNDIPDMLLHSRIHISLGRVMGKYGAACVSPASSLSSASNLSDIPSSAAALADRMHLNVRGVLTMGSRLLYRLVTLGDSLEVPLCESPVMKNVLRYLARYQKQDIVFVLHAVRRLSKNPHCLDALDNAGIFDTSAALLESPARNLYYDNIIATLARLCTISLERLRRMATQYPELVRQTIEYASSRNSRTATTYGRRLIVELAGGGRECCRVLKEVNAMELIVKLISREKWCAPAIRALGEWMKSAPDDILPVVVSTHTSEIWTDLISPLLCLSASSPTLDVYANAFLAFMQLSPASLTQACLASTWDVATGGVWGKLMDRYLQCSGLRQRSDRVGRLADAFGHVRLNNSGTSKPEAVAANHLSPTTRLTFLHLLKLLTVHLNFKALDLVARARACREEILIASQVDQALPVRHAARDLAGVLEEKLV